MKKLSLEAWFRMEDHFYNDAKSKPIEMKAAMAWAALSICTGAKEITWDEQRLLFGEFISKAMGLR